MIFHVPVLVESVIHFLITNPEGIYVDGTIGGGGHADAILKGLDQKGRLIGIDQDDEAVLFCQKRFSSAGNQILILHNAFEHIDRVLNELSISEIDGLFMDLGVSSHQIDTIERGFSYMSDGPLSMQMNTHQSLDAREIVNAYSEEVLADLFYRYGEERHARRIARAIVQERQKKVIQSTGELANLVRRITPSRYHVKILSRIWQAIRIEVNDELGQLQRGFKRIYPYLKMGGRIVVIGYHSLEDRLIKRFFRGECATFSKMEKQTIPSGYDFRVLTRRVVRPNEEEIQRNPRARSARLRAAEKYMPTYFKTAENVR
ncbi:16S rRNA (cytosine(1402)-N(4))-methyltransferase RsmH [bacterium]|nr:16S rRNA (cytosine(1402)-N(4))-methyltransferase RsmH [bacterium]